MAAFVVAADTPTDVHRAGTQLNIFPCSAIPSVFAAGEPFWVGYGFVPGPEERGGEGAAAIAGGTRFELEVDGEPVELRLDETHEGERVVQSLAIASFGTGLPSGWHRLTGRWYIAGRLVLTSDTSIEFVEP